MNEQEQEFLFSIKSRFFREVPHPKLILKALHELGNVMVQKPVLPEITLPSVSLIDVLDEHATKILDLKKSISLATDASTLWQAVCATYQVHCTLIEVLANQVDVNNTGGFPAILQSEPLDSYEILTFLKTQTIPENQIKTYICNELKTISPEAFSILTRKCVQAAKIRSNVRSNDPT